MTDLLELLELSELRDLLELPDHLYRSRWGLIASDPGRSPLITPFPLARLQPSLSPQNQAQVLSRFGKQIQDQDLLHRPDRICTRVSTEFGLVKIQICFPSQS